MKGPEATPSEAKPSESKQRAGIEELVARVQRLELAARKNVAGLLAGDWRTTFLGDGLEFHEARRYVEGDPVRRIDWNLTARLDEPHVRVDREERHRQIFVAVDVSPSMHSGFGRRTMLETAVELAATLAVSAVDAGDRLGLLLWADEVLAELPPRGGRRQLFEALRLLLEHTGPWTRPVAESDPRAAVHALERRRGRRFVVFLVSDFLDHDVPDDLRHLRRRHDVSLLHVVDPFEWKRENPLRLVARSPEGPDEASHVVASPDAPAEQDASDEGEAHRELRRQAARLRIATLRVSTEDDVAARLGSFFHHKRARRL